MAIITDMKKQRGFMIVEIDGEPSLRIPISVYRERPLQIGDAYDAKSYDDWLCAREYPHALERAVSFLAGRARTEHELLVCLKHCGYTERAIARVMQRLSQAGYINDAQFADQWTLARTSRAVGKRRIAQELRQKGVDSQAIDAAIAQIDEDDMLDAATALARKLLARTRGKDERDVRRKVTAALMRRGYDYATARQALDAAETEDESDP